eukprot:jgi/Tetstr1/427475/TSEL_001773.t1
MTWPFPPLPEYRALIRQRGSRPKPVSRQAEGGSGAMSALRERLSLWLLGACLSSTVVGVYLLGSARKSAKGAADLSVEDRLRRL